MSDVLPALRYAQVIPLYDNCGGSYPIGKQVDGFICGDSDPRSVEGKAAFAVAAGSLCFPAPSCCHPGLGLLP